MADRLPPSAYYAEPLSVAQSRGARLGQMRRGAEEKEAMMTAEMQAYGATSPRELMMMKATTTRQAAEQQKQQKRFEDFGNVMQDWEDQEPAARQAMLDDPEINKYMGEFIDTSTLKAEKEGSRFVATSKFPGRIQTAIGEMTEGYTRPGQEYISVKTSDPSQGYFREVVGTQKLAGKARDVATALQKNTSFIAKTLKISQEKALNVALESKQQSREGFILDMIKRAMTASMGRIDSNKIDKIEKNAGEIYDRLNPSKKVSESTATQEGEQDWLGATLEEE